MIIVNTLNKIYYMKDLNAGYSCIKVEQDFHHHDSRNINISYV